MGPTAQFCTAAQPGRSAAENESIMDELSRNEAGITTIEYVIILTIVVIGALVGWQRFGDALDAKIVTLTEHIENLGADRLGTL